MNTPEQSMAETVTFSVRMPQTSKERLEALAKSMGRSANYVASEAIASYIDTTSTRPPTWGCVGVSAAVYAKKLVKPGTPLA